MIYPSDDPHADVCGREDDTIPVGPIALNPRRSVYWTGKTAIGLRAAPPRQEWQNDPGTEAERLQTALLGFRAAAQPKRVPLAPRDWNEIGHQVAKWVAVGLLVVIVASLVIERLAA